MSDLVRCEVSPILSGANELVGIQITLETSRARTVLHASKADLEKALARAGLALVPAADVVTERRELPPSMQVVLEAEILGLQRDLALLRPLLAAFEAMTDAMLKYNATCGHDALREGAKYELARRAAKEAKG